MNTTARSENVFPVVSIVCKATLGRLKSQMSGIMRLAIELNYRPAPNPMREITLLRAPESDETEAYDLDSVFQLIRLLPEPDRTLVATAAFTGLRKSELRGLDWQLVDEFGCISMFGRASQLQELASC